MRHRAALYTVRVRQKWQRGDEDHFLGDVDGNGAYLRDVIATILTDFQSFSPDRANLVQCLGAQDEGDEELFMHLQHGETGVTADISRDEAVQYHQIPEDTYLINCAGLFRLPRAQRIGWLALHIKNGRGVKTLLATELLRQFQNIHPDLVLHITPFVTETVLRSAVDSGQVDSVRLVKYDQPSDRAFAATNKWVDAGEIGKVQLTVSGLRGHRLKSDLLQRFFGGNQNALGSIIEFQGMEFDEAKVEVVLENDLRRTFNIEKPNSGHPLTLDLDLDDGPDAADPSDERLLASLRSVLDGAV